MIAIDDLPVAIRESGRAVLWNREERAGKPTKVPYQVRQPACKAAVNNPATWAPFGEAVDACHDGKSDGAGIVLGEGLVGVDLDHCCDPTTGVIAPWAQRIIAQLQSYTEMSPSGAGVHVLLLAAATLTGRRKGPIEIYADGRYFTVTGHHLQGTPTTLEERTTELATLCAELFGPAALPSPGTGQRPRTAGKTSPRSERPAPADDDGARLALAFAARNGAQIRALWEGDTSAYASHSEADQALCNHLAFWLDQDAGRIDAMFRQSGLMREKWDTRRGDRTYGERTIENAIASVPAPYHGQPRATPRRAAVAVAAPPDPLEAAVPAAVPFAVVTPPDSFVTRYIAYATQRTDAPAAAHELMAVLTLSGLVGPQTRIPIATTTHGWALVLWGMYIVNSTIGRKTVVIETATDVLEQVLGWEALIPWEGSPQGLIQRLQTRDHQAAVFTRDEYSGLLKQINRGGHLAGLEQTFIRAFDGGRLENIRTRKRAAKGWEADTDTVEQPYLVKLTAATWDSLTTVATIDNVLDGLLARFVFVTGTATPRPLQLASDKLEADRAQLVAHARSFHARAGRTEILPVDPDVLAAAWTLEEEWQHLAQHTSRPDAAGPALKRLADTVLKVAGLLALDDLHHDPPVVRMAQFTLARQMADRWRVSTIQVLQALGRSEFAKQAEAVLATVRRRTKGVPLSALYRAHRNLRQRDFNEILEALTTQEQIARVQVPTGGRPATLIVARKE